MGLVQKRQYYGLLFVAPATIFFLIFFLYPIVIGFGLSLTDFTPLKPGLGQLAELPRPAERPPLSQIAERDNWFRTGQHCTRLVHLAGYGRAL